MGYRETKSRYEDHASQFQTKGMWSMVQHWQVLGFGPWRWPPAGNPGGPEGAGVWAGASAPLIIALMGAWMRIHAAAPP